MIFGRKKLKFETVAKFNYELDSNIELKEALNKLTLCQNEMNKKEYLSLILDLFKKEGIDINLKELDMLLLLRQKTDQILISEKEEKDRQ